MIGGIALGEQALDPSFSLLVAGAAGVAVHMVLSIVYGAVFVAATTSCPSSSAPYRSPASPERRGAPRCGW
jgi:hypothetical protein